MNLGADDFFTSGCGWLLTRFAWIFAAVCTGCAMSVVSLALGDLPNGLPDLTELWREMLGSPRLFFNEWAFLHLVITGLFAFAFIRMEIGGKTGYAGLSIAVAIAILAEELHLPTAHEAALAWTGCAAQAVSLVAALIFLHRWRMNRWAGELVALHAENEVRRGELEIHSSPEENGER